MASFQGPVFSQGRAWLPPWLASPSLESAVAACDTPSLFAMTGKDVDEVSCNTDPMVGVFKDVTNRTSLCLRLSEDKPNGVLSCQDVEGSELKNKASTANILGLSQPRAFVLQLSLSQTQTVTDAKLNVGVIPRLALEGTPNAGADNLGNVENQCQGRLLIVEKENCTNNDVQVLPISLDLASASPDTDVTELYVPPTQHLSQSRGKNEIAVNQKATRQTKRPVEDVPSRVRGRKKVKCATLGTDDVEAAIGLAVATAETLVIADIMNAHEMYQGQRSKAILDMALSLKRGREAIGLDRFTLESLSCEASHNCEFDEDLVDDALQAEYLVTFPHEQEAAGTAPCGYAFAPVGMPQIECPLKTKLPLTASKLVENEIETNEQENPQSECERTYNDMMGERQKVIDGPLASNDDGEVGVMSHDHGEAQAGAQKDSFNSRWLGGWTGVKLLEDKKVGKASWDCAQDAVKRLAKCHLKFETSELSESCQSLPPQASGHQTDGNKGLSENHDGIHEAEVLTTGSCAEILLALSQASVKSSLQEPLCSFVPCSVNMRLKQSPTEKTGCNDDGLNPDGGDGKEDGTEANTKMPELMAERADSLQIDSVMGRPCDDQNIRVGQSETPAIRVVKRVHANSLRAYSMNPVSPLLDAVVQTSNKQDSMQCADDKEEASPLMTCRQADVTVKTGEPVDKSADNGSRIELILQDSGMQDSPPVIWHRGKKRRLRACRIVVESNLTGDVACDFMSVDAPTERYEKVGTGKVAYCRRNTSSTSSQLFKGVEFLITGFPASQRSSSEEVCRKIQDHGGVVLSCIPSFSRRDQIETNLKQQPLPMQHAVVVAPYKVRTLKYLYGCAAGLLIVKPNWIDQCLSTNTLLAVQKLKGKALHGQHHTGLCSGKGGTKKCLFSKIAAFVHGQHSYYSKLALLIQHGGGKVFRSLKSLLQPDIKMGSLIGIVVAEHPSKLPQAVKETAASAGLSIVSGNWIIDSLLDGRLCTLPAAVNACSVRGVVNSKAQGISQERAVVMRNRSTSLAMAATEKAVLIEEDTYVNEQSVSFLGKGAARPTLSRMGISFVLEIARAPNAKKRPSGHMYYKEACINDTIFSAGDIVEIRPESKDEKEPYVAQIESFYAASHCRRVSTRSAKLELKEGQRKPCCLCCRWFYRPSDTGFLCVGSEKEVYLSQHFDDRAPVDSIIRKVQMVLVLEGKVLTNDTEKGWQAPMGTSYTAETADYVCRYFYDFRKESLHQLKAALTS